MNERNNSRAITLKDLWTLFIRRLVVIVLVAAIVVGGIFAVDMVFYDPQYSSTATIYILRQSEVGNTSSGEAANELTLALRMVYDCNYFLKSRTVLNAVIEDLGLEMSYNQLYSRISVTNPANTRILEITARGDSPEQARDIVDRICDIGPGKIEETMGFSQVHLYEYGNLPVTPSNSPSLLKYIVVGIAAAVMTYGLFLLMFILDDRIRCDEDIEKTLGLSVLAVIPNAGSGDPGPYGYYKSGKGSYTTDNHRKQGRKNAHSPEKRS